MSIAVSTRHLPPERRFEYWREVISERFLPLEPERCGGLPFEGALTLARLGSLPLTTIQVQAQRVIQNHRTAPEEGAVFLNLQAAGGMRYRQGHEGATRPGSGFLIDASQPFELRCPERMTQVCVSIPRAELRARLRRRVAFAGVELSPSRTAERLCLGYLYDVARGRTGGLRDPADLHTHLLDLLGYALDSRFGVVALPRRARDVALYLRARGWIETACADPELTPSSLAAGFGLSLRGLQRLFARLGDETPGEAIVNGRLDLAGRRLADPRWRRRSVAEIAYASGFADLSYFCRRFKRLTGRSPRRYRQASRETQSRSPSLASR